MISAATKSTIQAAELQQYEREFRAIVADATGLVSGLDRGRLNWRPGPARWSITGCLAHLNVVAERMLPVMHRRIEDALDTGIFAEGPFRHSRSGNFFLRMLEPPYRLKVPVPVDLAAASEHDPWEVITTFNKLHEQIGLELMRADGLDLAGITITSPFRRPLRLSLGQWFGFLAAHDRRHLWQARNVRREPGFPLSGA